MTADGPSELARMTGKFGDAACCAASESGLCGTGIVWAMLYASTGLAILRLK